MFDKFKHWLTHLFGNNSGRVVTWSEGDDICVGFECSGCGEVDTKTIDRVPSRLVIGKFDSVDMVEEK